MMRACRVIVYEALTQIDLALGRPEAAGRWAAAAIATTQGGELAVEFAFAARAQALVLAAAGDHGAAAELALRAADRAEAGGSPVEASRCLILAGRSLAQVGERSRAIAALETAEERLTLSGAFGFRDQAQKELRRLGRRVTRRSGLARPDAGLRALTDRERELAGLVARGLTNRQIAASIYLSEKTVERHLSHIFAKLGVSSRAGLAAIVAADPGTA
jgi:DNA-binding NarL/FixJ family response regulator